MAVSVLRKAYQPADMLMAAVSPSPVTPPSLASRYIARPGYIARVFVCACIFVIYVHIPSLFLFLLCSFTHSLTLSLTHSLTQAALPSLKDWLHARAIKNGRRVREPAGARKRKSES